MARILGLPRALVYSTSGWKEKFCLESSTSLSKSTKTCNLAIVASSTMLTEGRRTAWWYSKFPRVNMLSIFPSSKLVEWFNTSTKDWTLERKASVTVAISLERSTQSLTGNLKSDFPRMSRIGRQSWKLDFSFISPKHTFGWTYSRKNSLKFPRFILRAKFGKDRKLHIMAVFAV